MGPLAPYRDSVDKMYPGSLGGHSNLRSTGVTIDWSVTWKNNRRKGGTKSRVKRMTTNEVESLFEKQDGRKSVSYKDTVGFDSIAVPFLGFFV